MSYNTFEQIAFTVSDYTDRFSIALFLCETPFHSESHQLVADSVK